MMPQHAVCARKRVSRDCDRTFRRPVRWAGMRKAGLALGLMLTAGAGGLALAGTGLGPSAGILAGLLIVAGVGTFFGVRTRELALFAVGLLVFTITWNGIRLGGGAMGDVFLALAFAAVITHVVGTRGSLPLPPWLFVAGVGFLLAGVLSMVFPPNQAIVEQSTLTELSYRLQSGVSGAVKPFSNRTELIYFEAAVVVVPVLIMAVGTTPRRCRWLIDLWVAGSLVNAAVGVLDHIGIHLGPIPYTYHRSAGLTVQSNYLALTCVIALPLAGLWIGRSRRWTAAGTAALALLLGGVYASGSRAGTVGALLAFAATVAVLPRLRPMVVRALPYVGMALVVVLMFTSTGSKILHQVRLSGGDSTTAVSDYRRSTAASVAWSQVKARPIEGVGFSVISAAHDIYLELLNAGGIIALASFVVFIAGLAGAVRKALPGLMRREALTSGVAIMAWLAFGIFANQVADKFLYVVPGILLAIARASRLPDAATARATAVEQPAVGQARQALVGAAAP
jgi:O-Antigen ligase